MNNNSLSARECTQRKRKITDFRIHSSSIAEFIRTKMVWLLRDSLWPLCIISKVLCTHTFSRKELRTSVLGNLLAASMAIAYSVFHLDAAQRRAVGNEENVNTVTAIIDSYNRYCGFCGFAINIVTSIVVQKKIICTIQLLERVDFVLEQNYSLRVDNTTWIM